MLTPLNPSVLQELAEVQKLQPLGGTKRPRKRLSTGNGVDPTPEMDDPLTVAFQIGEEIIHVPEMRWDMLEEVFPILDRPPDPGERWYQSKVRDFDIFLIAARNVRPDLTLQDIKGKLTLRQANQLSEKLLELLQVSGFSLPGEVRAASGSTETLTVSSPDLSEEEQQALQSGTPLSEL